MWCNNMDKKVTHHKGGRDIGGEEVHEYIFCQQDCCSELCKPTNRKKNIHSLQLPRTAQQPGGIPVTSRHLFLKALYCFLSHAWSGIPQTAQSG